MPKKDPRAPHEILRAAEKCYDESKRVESLEDKNKKSKKAFNIANSILPQLTNKNFIQKGYYERALILMIELGIILGEGYNKKVLDCYDKLKKLSDLSPGITERLEKVQPAIKFIIGDKPAVNALPKQNIKVNAAADVKSKAPIAPPKALPTPNSLPTAAPDFDEKSFSIALRLGSHSSSTKKPKTMSAAADEKYASVPKILALIPRSLEEFLSSTVDDLVLPFDDAKRIDRPKAPIVDPMSPWGAVQAHPLNFLFGAELNVLERAIKQKEADLVTENARLDEVLNSAKAMRQQKEAELASEKAKLDEAIAKMKAMQQQAEAMCETYEKAFKSQKDLFERQVEKQQKLTHEQMDMEQKMVAARSQLVARAGFFQPAPPALPGQSVHTLPILSAPIAMTSHPSLPQSVPLTSHHLVVDGQTSAMLSLTTLSSHTISPFFHSANRLASAPIPAPVPGNSCSPPTIVLHHKLVEGMTGQNRPCLGY